MYVYNQNFTLSNGLLRLLLLFINFFVKPMMVISSLSQRECNSLGILYKTKTNTIQYNTIIFGFAEREKGRG